MVGDAIEDAMDDEEDEEETEGIVNKVLDEIGITMGDGFVSAPQNKVCWRRSASLVGLYVFQMASSYPRSRKIRSKKTMQTKNLRPA